MGLARALFAALLTVAGLGLAPASAGAVTATYSPPTLGWLGVDENADSTQQGYVNGSVIADSPYVQVRISKAGGGVVSTDVIPNDPGGEVFHAQVWGDIESPGGSRFQISARACTTVNTGCDDWVTFEPFVRVHDTAPEVSFSGDTAIDDNSPYSVRVGDRNAGRVYALWRGHATEIVDRNADYTDLLSRPGFLTDGVGDLRVVRCRDRYLGAGPLTETQVQPCTDFGIAKTIAVDRTLSTDGALLEPTVGPNRRQVSLRVSTLDPGVHRLSWSLQDAVENPVAAGGPDSVSVTPARDGTYTATYILSLPPGLDEGSYLVKGLLSRLTAYGNFTSNLSGEPRLTVDATGPVSGAVIASRTGFYPYPDGYQDTVQVTVSGQVEAWDSATYEVLDTRGDPVRTEEFADSTAGQALVTWDGRGEDGGLVPAGVYRIRVTPRDRYGNAGDPATSPPIEVFTAQLSHKTWQASVTASASRATTTVGRCSRVRRPSAHGWTGSLGLISGSRCTSNPAAMLARTIHQVVVPRLPQDGVSRYDTVAVRTYGGSTNRTAKSIAGLRYLTVNDVPVAARTMTAPIGYHAGITRKATGLVRPDNTFHWDTYTASGRRYDIRNFTITLSYTVLR